MSLSALPAYRDFLAQFRKRWLVISTRMCRLSGLICISNDATLEMFYVTDFLIKASATKLHVMIAQINLQYLALLPIFIRLKKWTKSFIIIFLS